MLYNRRRIRKQIESTEFNRHESKVVYHSVSKNVLAILGIQGYFLSGNQPSYPKRKKE